MKIFASFRFGLEDAVSLHTVFLISVVVPGLHEGPRGRSCYIISGWGGRGSQEAQYWRKYGSGSENIINVTKWNGRSWYFN